LSHFRRAIELDPHHATPFGLAARCYSQLKARGWLTDGKRDMAEAERLARRTAEFGPRDAVALCTAGLALAYVVGGFEEAVALTDQALALNANLGWAWYFGGWVKLWSGEPRTAIERLTQAMRLSPTDSELWGIQDAMAAAQFVIGDYEEAIKWAKAALRSKPDFSLSLIIVAAGNQLIGRPVEAQSAVKKLLASDPSLRISGLDEIFIELRQPKDFTRFATVLRQAGLPE
jgi:tetratricopeptide (TPR) repeat protein